MVPHRGLLKTLRVFIQGFVDLFFTQVVMLVSERAAADGIGRYFSRFEPEIRPRKAGGVDEIMADAGLPIGSNHG